MAYQTESSPPAPSSRTALLPPRHVPTTAFGLRLHLLGRALAHSVTALLGTALLPLWITIVAVSPLTIVAGLVLPVTGLVRGYANANRRAAGTLLGETIPRPYRVPAGGAGWLTRVATVIRDPASWRDAFWLLVHPIVAFTLCWLQVLLFIGTVFYLIYPFLYWVTPQNVFGTPFGYFTLHSVARSFWLEPLALVSFALWYVSAVPLSRIEASVTRALLR